MKKQLTYSVFTDVGGREVNEDSLTVCQTEDGFCFVLCDGLGGHGMGDAASSLVTKVFENRFRQPHRPRRFLKETFQAAQESLLAEQAERNACKKMKTTVTAVVTDKHHAYIGHVGDSRVYVFQNDQVLCRTLDHSIPQMLVQSGELSEEEIRNHPERNMLLRVMGTPWEEPMYELLPPIPLRKCQAFLLCSDGFWELIHERDMCRLLKESATPAQWLQQMVEIVRKNGVGKDMDNFSAVAAWCQ